MLCFAQLSCASRALPVQSCPLPFTCHLLVHPVGRRWNQPARWYSHSFQQQYHRLHHFRSSSECAQLLARPCTVLVVSSSLARPCSPRTHLPLGGATGRKRVAFFCMVALSRYGTAASPSAPLWALVRCALARSPFYSIPTISRSRARIPTTLHEPTRIANKSWATKLPFFVPRPPACSPPLLSPLGDAPADRRCNFLR